MIASNHGTIAVDKLKVAALILAGCAALNFATLYAVIVWKAFTASGSTWQGQALNVVIFGVYYGLRSAAFVAFAYAARRDRFALCVVAAGILLHTVVTGFQVDVLQARSSTAGLGLITLTLVDYSLVGLTAAIAWFLPWVSRAAERL